MNNHKVGARNNMSDNMTLQGTIMKGIGGFYYVEAAGQLYECKARGIFRKDKIIPLTGDRVTITVRVQDENTIDVIKPRHNALKRPPIANVDTMFCVVSLTQPSPAPLLIDKMTCIASHHNIESIIVLTKNDLAQDDMNLEQIYTNAGFKTIKANAVTGEGIDTIAKLMKGKTSVLTGNSGVGKSTILNAIDDSLDLETGVISQKLGRGKHTTRTVELFHIAGGLVADTPGFASLDLSRDEHLNKEELATTFPEFSPYLGMCKFTSCAHLQDKGCEITRQLALGNIEQTRYNSYVALYDEMKDRKEWEK